MMDRRRLRPERERESEREYYFFRRGRAKRSNGQHGGTLGRERSPRWCSAHKRKNRVVVCCAVFLRGPFLSVAGEAPSCQWRAGGERKARSSGMEPRESDRMHLS